MIVKVNFIFDMQIAPPTVTHSAIKTYCPYMTDDPTWGNTKCNGYI